MSRKQTVFIGDRFTIKAQAEKWKDRIDPRAYRALMNYEISITD
jgi:hypothetical protein